MADNISIKISADVVDLQAKFAVAKAESQALTGELSKLARQAATGVGGESLKADLTKAAEAATTAQAKVRGLREELTAVGGAPKLMGDGMSDLRHVFQGLIDPIRGVYDGVGELAEVFAAGAVVDRVSQFTASVMENAEQIYHQAEVLGISTDAYQAYANSARDAGVPIDTVNTALERFGKAQGDAQIGSRQQAEAFQELGVSAALPAQEALPAVARALEGLENSAQRARLETVLFGRSGQEIKPALDQWAAGTDNLIGKLRDQGEIIDSDVIKKSHDATIAWTQFTTKLNADVTPAVVALGAAALKFAEDSEKAFSSSSNDRLKAWADERAAILRRAGASELEIQNGARVPAAMPAPPEPTLIKPQQPDYGNYVEAALREGGELAQLTALDTKLQERQQLTANIAQAQKALADANTIGDKTGIEAATRALADYKKQLDAINKPEASTAGRDALAQAREQISALAANEGLSADARLAKEQSVWSTLLAGDKLNAEQRAEVAREMNAEKAAAGHAEAEEERQFAESAAQLADANARSDAQRDVELAKQTLEQKKELLAEEYAAHQITAQQKYAATVAALQEEEAAELAAQQQIINSDATALAQKHEAGNQMVLIAAQTNTQIAAAARALTDELKTEAQKQAENWRAANQEIMSAESQLVSDIFSKHQSLAADLGQIAFKMGQQEAQKDISALTEMGLGALGMPGTDKGAAEGGLLMKGVMSLLGVGGQGASAGQTAALTANTAALTGNTAVTTTGTAAATVHTAATTANASATITNAAATTTNAAATTANTGGLLMSAVSWVENTVATIANTVATDAQALADLLPFADGGYKPAGSFAIVGERGPEILGPSVAGHITPNSIFRSGGGSGGGFDMGAMRGGDISNSNDNNAMTQHNTYAPSFHGFDQSQIGRYFRENIREFGSLMAAAQRGGHLRAAR